MIKIKKETVKKTTLTIEIKTELKKELETYLKVAKANSYIDKIATLNDMIEEALNQVVDNEEYKKLKATYEREQEAKRKVMREAKAKQRAKAKEKAKAKERVSKVQENIESVAEANGISPKK